MKVITQKQYYEIEQESTKYLNVLHKTNGFDGVAELNNELYLYTFCKKHETSVET